MVANSTSLPSQTYSIAQLLEDDLTIVIPDMQRDYCWGNPPASRESFFPHTNKAATFVRGIIQLYLLDKPATLGLVYGYEHPKASKHIHIIDGQQRITTVFLLIGMLYRRTGNPRLRHLLISDYQLADEHEPRLVYQARRETEYFMSDLVMKFFLERQGHISQLEQCNWYYSSYHSDPSVQSFIGAMRQIDEVLRLTQSNCTDFDFDALAAFLCHHIKFLYCNLSDRSYAERMFISINTTGEPLTISQKLRSLTVALAPGDKELPELWNRIEDFCWQHRHLAGIDDFVSAHLNRIGDFKDFDFGTFYAEYQAFERLITVLDSSGITALQAFAMSPALAFIQRWGAEASDHDVLRFWHLLCNWLRYQKPTASGSDDQVAMSLVHGMRSPKITSLLGWKQAPSRIVNDEERAKLAFIHECGPLGAMAEELLDRAEAHPLLNGKASRIIGWCIKDGVTPDIALSAMRHYVDSIYALFGIDIDKQPHLDLLRRALLSIRHKEYPIVRRGESVLSLCWNDYDWQRLMANAPGLIRQIIDRIGNFSHSRDTIEQALEEIVARFADVDYPYYFIIKDGQSLSNCRKRQLLHPCPPFIGIFDWERGHTRWWIEQNELDTDGLRWTPWRAYGSRCLYSDHLTYNVAIDIYYTPAEKTTYRLELFQRNDTESAWRKNCDVESLALALDTQFYLDRHRGRYCCTMRTHKQLLHIVRKIHNFFGKDFVE